MNECNSIESAHITYYQINRDVILNRARDYYENDKERLREQAKINTETYLKKKKNKKENIVKIDITICLKKKTKIKRISKKLSRGKKKSQYNNK